MTTVSKETCLKPLKTSTSLASLSLSFQAWLHTSERLPMGWYSLNE